MTRNILLTDSAEVLLQNLDIYSINNFAVGSKIFSSACSGWVPLVDMYIAEHKGVELNVRNAYTIPFQHFDGRFIGRTVESFTNFNHKFCEHNINSTRFSYTNLGETVDFAVAPGYIFTEEPDRRLKTLFMVCISDKLLHKILKADVNGVTRNDEVKLYMDSELLKPKYQKVYKILDALYIQPLLVQGVEMCVKPSESFMAEVLRSENDVPIVSEEDFEEFNRILREEII